MFKNQYYDIKPSTYLFITYFLTCTLIVLATLTLITLFVKMWNFSKKFFKKNFVKENKKK
jgi:hypothetical protein